MKQAELEKSSARVDCDGSALPCKDRADARVAVSEDADGPTEVMI